MKKINKGHDIFVPKSSFVTDLPFGQKYEKEFKDVMYGKTEVKLIDYVRKQVMYM